LTARLFERDPQPRYAAFFERALYNDILSSIAPDTGRVIYFHPLFGDFKTYLKGCECCEGSGIENTGRYGEGIYFRDAESLYVNLYIPSEVRWKEKGLVIQQEGNIPWQDSVRFTVVRADVPVLATIRLRIPTWLKGSARFQMAGESGDVGDKPELSIQRNWQTGDQFTLDLSPATRLERAKDNPQLASLTYGPLVLAARLGRDGMPDDTGDKEIAKSIPRPEVPGIIGMQDDPSNWLRLVDPATLTFEARDCGPASGLRFQPVHDVHHERFSVYLPFLTNEQAANRTSPRENGPNAPKDPALVDQVMPGLAESETSHDLSMERSITGMGPQRRPWRDADPDGWFSYTLAIAPDAKLDLICTWWGGDKARSFYILVNGHKLTTVELNNSNPGRYFETRHPIPPEVLSGQQNVNIRIQGIGKGRAGGLFGLRLKHRDLPEAK
jgi:hypothetical protein